jgi:hypothetical protein
LHREQQPGCFQSAARQNHPVRLQTEAPRGVRHGQTRHPAAVIREIDRRNGRSEHAPDEMRIRKARAVPSADVDLRRPPLQLIEPDVADIGPGGGGRFETRRLDSEKRSRCRIPSADLVVWKRPGRGGQMRALCEIDIVERDAASAPPVRRSAEAAADRKLGRRVCGADAMSGGERRGEPVGLFESGLQQQHRQAVARAVQRQCDADRAGSDHADVAGGNFAKLRERGQHGTSLSTARETNPIREATVRPDFRPRRAKEIVTRSSHARMRRCDSE